MYETLLKEKKGKMSATRALRIPGRVTAYDGGWLRDGGVQGPWAAGRDGNRPLSSSRVCEISRCRMWLCPGGWKSTLARANACARPPVGQEAPQHPGEAAGQPLRPGREASVSVLQRAHLSEEGGPVLPESCLG